MVDLEAEFPKDKIASQMETIDNPNSNYTSKQGAHKVQKNAKKMLCKFSSSRLSEVNAYECLRYKKQKYSKIMVNLKEQFNCDPRLFYEEVF